MHSKSGPDSTLYRYGFCEVAQRQAVLVRQDKLSGRAIKSDRAKVVMTAGCISKNCGIINYTCREKEITRQIIICNTKVAKSCKTVLHNKQCMCYNKFGAATTVGG